MRASNLLLTLGLLSVCACDSTPTNDSTDAYAGKTRPSNALTTEFEDHEPYFSLPEEAFLGEPVQRVNELPTAPGFYELHLESYCLKAGTYRPTKGAGYVVAPIKGPYAGHILSILRNAPAHRAQFSQEIIQELIWSIIYGVKYNEMPQAQRDAGAALLSPAQINEITALQSVPTEWVGGWMPNELRDAMDLTQRMRNLLVDPNAPYEELERLAVPLPPHDRVMKDVPVGTWAATGDGAMWRVLPQGYQRIWLQIYVPYPYKIERDAEGRITRFELLDGKGFVMTSTYQDEPAMVRAPSGRQYPAWQFKRLTATGPNPEGGEPWTLEIENEGWVFQRGAQLPDHAGLNSSPAGRAERLFSVVPQATIGLLDAPPAEWQRRVDNAREAYERGNWAREQAGQFQRPPEEMVNDATDLSHYRDGARAAFGEPSGRLEWLNEHTARMLRAIGGATRMINEMGRSRRFDPTSRAAVPGDNSYQRLGGTLAPTE